MATTQKELEWIRDNVNFFICLHIVFDGLCQENVLINEVLRNLDKLVIGESTGVWI